MNAQPCSVCQKREAQFLCFCSEAQLCDVCIATHILENPQIQHKTTALPTSDLSPPRPSLSLSSSKELVYREARRLEAFQTEVTGQFQRLRTYYVTEVDNTLQALLREIDLQIAQLREDLRVCLESTEETLKPPVASELWRRATAGVEKLLTLSLDFKEVNIAATLRKSCAYTIGYVQGPSLASHIYKFFGGSTSVGLFNVVSEEFEQSTVPIKFAHNACWCATPNGQVLVTGGSITGRSRNTVLSYNPASGEINDLAPMRIARRSHASICSNDYCYVFGGILDEDRISLCESFHLGKGVWSGLEQQMKERRAYHGACECAGLLVVCGGGETSSCEVLSPMTGEFRLVELPNLGLMEAACALSVGDSVLIFHGNFSGLVSRFDPNTGVGKEEHQLCYGNSWSNCPPLLVRDTVYLLRSDSIFKFHTVTGRSSYVIRLTKTIKRREYD